MNIDGYAGRIDQIEPAEVGPALLVRPDGHIAASGTPDEVRSAMQYWCGHPR